MASKYEILNPCISESDSSLMKNVTLRVNGHSLDNISKCTERSADLKVMDKLGCKVLNECYIDLTLDKLRELDSDVDAQEKYIYSRSKFLSRNMVNVLVIKLTVDARSELDEQDYGYLNSLLSWGSNDLYLMPLLEFTSECGREDRVRRYDEFVTKMLELKDSWCSNVNVAMSIPNYYPRRPIGHLFDLYGDEKPTFVAMDFNNSRMDKPNGKIATVRNHFKKENEENTFLYGINVKPYKKGADISDAWDIYTVHGMFNAIGPTHSKPHPIVLPNDWRSVGRMFDEKELKYPRMDAKLGTFIDWMGDNYDIQLSEDFSKNGRNLYTYLKRYNFEKANETLIHISDAIKEGDEDFIKDVREHMPDEMKNTKIQ